MKKKKFKVKNLFKNKTLLVGIVIGLTLGISGVALASTLLYSKDITYDNSSSGLSSTNLQDALDELYEQAKKAGGCPEGYSCIKTVGAKLVVSEGVITSGDGLYADSVTPGRYFYRGTTVNNYITFNNESWRIISVESDGTLKIIRNEQLSSTQKWDDYGNRNSSTSTYCTNPSQYGCNAWAATANLVGTPSEFTQYFKLGNPTSYTAIYTGTVTADASLNTYLNTTYYNSLSSTAQKQVVTGIFNVSTPGYLDDTETLEVDAEQEKQYQWKGKVALATLTEYLRASTNSACTSLKASYGSSSVGNCNTSNWLWTISGNEWTVSPFVTNNRDNVWRVSSGGYINDGGPAGADGVRPVLHLSSDITLSGSGTSNDHYTIN